ncbi:MAG: YdcF family protein [Smithellaceae bacterium]
MIKRKKRYLIWLIIIMLIGNVIAYAPYFLLYSSDYRKTDAIVLFLGPDFSARQKEAYKIINEGMADYLIIPAYQKVYRISDKGTGKSLSPNLSLRNSVKKGTPLNPSPYFYEDTHIEIIEAKKTMAYFGLKSAIFVSSPYHMRRIKLIVSKVFPGEQREYYFVPTSYEKAPAYFGELSWTNWKKVGREYGKIIWFSLYILWEK